MIFSVYMGDYGGKFLFDVIESLCLPLEKRKNHLLGPLYLSELYDMVWFWVDINENILITGRVRIKIESGLEFSTTFITTIIKELDKLWLTAGINGTVGIKLLGPRQNFIFGSFSVLKLITCLDFETPNLLMFENFSRYLTSKLH